jgi:hypothetical protein
MRRILNIEIRGPGGSILKSKHIETSNTKEHSHPLDEWRPLNLVIEILELRI